MENNENVIVKSKSNKGVIIALILIVLGLCSFIAYDKFIDKGTPTTKNNETGTVTTDSTVNADETYKQFINNIKSRKNAEIVSFRNVDNYPNGNKHFVLGTDNKLYVETFNSDDTKIPGAIGSGGEYTGKYINIDNVVRIFHTYHTAKEGGSLDGLLLLKDDGSLYIMRTPENEEYKIEKLDNKNIVGAYDGISASGATLVVDILGNTYEIK